MEGMAGHHEVFISYASPDGPTASAICKALEAAGVRCWIAPRDVRPGQPYAAAIVEAIETVRLMIVVLSASTNASQQVEREVERAGNEKIVLLPFRIDHSPMSKSLEFFLSAPHWFDATTPPVANHLPHLVSVVRERLGAPIPPPQPQPQPQPEPRQPVDLGIASVIALLGAALLAVGVVVRWDNGNSFLQNSFGGNARHGGAFTSLAPIAIVLGAVLGSALVRYGRTQVLGAGLLLGFGFAGAAKYLSVAWAAWDSSAGVLLGLLLALAGAGLVLAVGFRAGQSELSGQPQKASAAMIAFALGGATLIILGTTIPFNTGGPDLPADQIILERSSQEAFDPIATALAIAACGLLMLVPWGRTLWPAALMALSIASALFWVRYIGIPAIESERIAQPAAGGFVGLLGAVIALVGGWVGYRRAAERRPSIR
jgi:hypothetical protein